ncbi:MAG TPA: gamma-glutamylcyclotransferase family protein [Gemmatimonadota bacterium]|nr:gamma-glutamylcyclotransferase family protein [Gemmatimonadota bacterium]
MARTGPPEVKALGPPTGLPLFVYGTLLDAGFTSSLLERRVENEPARLLDFELLTLEGLSYPTVFEAPGEVVAGGLYRDLTGEDYDRLDAYEGVHEGLYVRIESHAVAGEHGSRRDPEPVFVYVVTEKTLRRYGAL